MAPKGQLKPQTTDPVKVVETYTAQSIRKVGDAYVFDMGQNLSGFPKIKVHGKEGDVIRLTVGEHIYEDGSVNQSQSGSPYYYEYILKGGEEEIWHPRFSYYGYRYIQVDGAKPEIVGDLLSGSSLAEMKRALYPRWTIRGYPDNKGDRVLFCLQFLRSNGPFQQFQRAVQ